ncbi:MAG: Asp-tRNA(Asn)/Glu-tRNA(Gln) amidotransferase subunit GatC [Desulfovibrio sp.]|nr:Asp-tRNA(Asn)/Glu-tRNA(Gln) amidotransferase subunit GatC [Desulfovibrio sp.]
MTQEQPRPVSLEEVRHMAALSRLVVTEEEERLFARQFGDILAHMALLSKVDTEGVEPLYSPLAHAAATRPDEAANLRTRKEVLANAPETDGEYFIVPRIV